MKTENGMLSKFYLQDDEFSFMGKALSIRDSMFMCCYLLRSGQETEVKPVLLKAGKHMEGNPDYFVKVLWLWMLGEYVNKSGSVQLLTELKDIISGITAGIEKSWSKPMKSWINSDLQEDIYLTNLSPAYGALLSINNGLKSETVIQLMKAMKEFMFKKFMKGSKLASKISDNMITGDIGLAAVPFAMVDAGNQILVEALFEVEEQLVTGGVRLSANDTYYGGCVRNYLTLLLSWYYSEKGDISKAKGLLNHIKNLYEKAGKLSELVPESHKEEILYRHWAVENGEIPEESPIVYILYAIAEQNILLKEKGAGQTAQTRIIHAAGGNGNPYLFEVTERYPRHPQAGDTVTVRAVTQPYSEGQKLNVIYYTDGLLRGKAEMKPVTTKKGEKIWETGIGSFNAYEKVSYRFELTEGSNETASHSYEFITQKWVKLQNIEAIGKDSDGIRVYYKRIEGVNGIPCLKITDRKDGIKYTLCLEKESSGEIYDNGPNSIQLENYIVNIAEDGKDLSISELKGSTIIKSHATAGFLELLTDGSGAVGRLKFNFRIADGERLFGTGERYSHLDLRGKSIENYVYNQYRDQGLRTYIPIPFVMSSGGYGLYLDTAFYAQFRFGTRLSDLMEIEAEIDGKTNTLDLYAFAGSPKKVLGAYSEVAGKPELPPKWSFGPWMSSNNWDSQKEASMQVALNKKYEIPSTVIVLEQWSDEATYYIFNDAQYDIKDGSSYFSYNDYRFPEWGRWPNPRKMVEDFHSEGLKVILWQMPSMKYMDGIAHAQRDEDERVMLEKGYHIRHENGEPYTVPYHEWFKYSLVPDFTNPEAREWWLNKRLYLVRDVGIDGFKTDGGECVYGNDLVLYDGTPGKAMRNKFPNLYIGSFYEFIKKHTEGQGVTFSRAGYTGAHKMPLHWAGDERSTFEAFRASIRAGLSSAMSGLAFWGWDLGGFNGDIPTAELYVRATEMAAFCPVMQYHAETKGEFNQDRTPWNIAERTGEQNVIALYKKYADLRMNILPYIYSQAIDSCHTGIPMMRSMFMEYPGDSSCTDMYGQYMFGDSLLVAPVIEEKSTEKDVYFPKGKWLELFHNTVFEGKSYQRINAGLGEIPVYIKENSVVPLNLSDSFSLCSHVSNDVTGYRNLCFMIYVTDSLQYSFKDDLGYEYDMFAEKKEECISIKIECKKTSLPVAIILRAVDSNTSVKVNNCFVNKEVSGGDLLLKVNF